MLDRFLTQWNLAHGPNEMSALEYIWSSTSARVGRLIIASMAGMELQFDRGPVPVPQHHHMIIGP
jgi:hypothetical protein